MTLESTTMLPITLVLLGTVVMVFAIAIIKQRKTLMIVSCVLALAVTGFGTIVYPAMIHRADKVVEIDQTFVTALDGDLTKDSWEPEDWGEITGANEITIRVEDQDNPELSSFRQIDTRTTLITERVSIRWHDPGYPYLQQLRPKLVEVTCHYDDPFVDFIEQGCQHDEVTSALHIPGGQSMLELMETKYHIPAKPRN